MMKRRERGQSTAEYAIVIALVLGAAIAMQTYVKRTIQDRVADAADQVPDVEFDDGNKSAVTANRPQYEPLYASSNTNANTNMTSNAKMDGTSGSASNVTYNANTTSNRTGVNMEAGAN